MKRFAPVLLFFIILNVLFFAARTWLVQWNVDLKVLAIGNLFLFLVTLLSFIVAQKGLKSSNPHAFVRSVYSSILLKLFLCIIAAFAYIAVHRTELNKPALFTCMGLYLVYTFLEVSVLMKMLKQKANG